MDVFTEMAKHSVFTIEDVKKIVGNEKTAYSQMNRLIKKGKDTKEHIFSSQSNNGAASSDALSNRLCYN